MNEQVQPDWVTVLREHREAHGGAKTAERIGYSTAVVSQVISGTYKGDMKAVQQRVEGALMGATVRCPVVGDLPRNRCLDYQRQPFAATNHVRVQLYKACPGCKHRRGAE